jgi:hypothetical protein
MMDEKIVSISEVTDLKRRLIEAKLENEEAQVFVKEFEELQKKFISEQKKKNICRKGIGIDRIKLQATYCGNH